MGEQQFTEIFIKYFSLGIEKLHTHIAQRKALHILRIAAQCFQGYQTALSGDNGMSKLCSHRITVTGGTGGRIGHATCGQKHPFGRNRLILSLHTDNLSVFRKDPLYPGSSYGYIPPAKLILQAVQHRSCLVRYRKNTVAPLRFQSTAIFLKKCHDPLRRKSRKGTEKEPSVPGRILLNLLGRAVVGYIAAAFSRNQQFLAQPVVPFQQKHSAPLPGCGNGCEHACRTTANDNTIVIHSPSTCFS